MQSETMEYEKEQIAEQLDQAQIPYIFLKGTRLRSLYPEAWMRTRSDIDVLVHEEDLEKASYFLTKNLGYRYESKTHHDIALFSETNIMIELHFSLNEDVQKIDHVLDQVWKFRS